MCLEAQGPDGLTDPVVAQALSIVAERERVVRQVPGDVPNAGESLQDRLDGVRSAHSGGAAAALHHPIDDPGDARGVLGAEGRLAGFRQGARSRQRRSAHQ